MPTVNQMEIEGTLYDIEDTEARANASEVPAMEIRLQDVEEKASANETAIENLAQSVPVAQYAAGSTDIESFSISGASHALRDTAARALLVPATTAKTGLVKPDGSTITVDADGTIHGTPSSSLTPEYMAGGTDIIAFDVSGTSHAVRDAGARALLVPATTLQTGLVKPDGSTITIDADGTIHAAGGGAITALTQAQYDALTPEQKMNGALYLVSNTAPASTSWLTLGRMTGATEATAVGNVSCPAVGAIAALSGNVYAGFWINTLTNVSTVFSGAELARLAALAGLPYVPASSQIINRQGTSTPYLRWAAPGAVDDIFISVPNFPTITFRATNGTTTIYLFTARADNYIIRNGVRYS